MLSTVEANCASVDNAMFALNASVLVRNNHFHVDSFSKARVRHELPVFRVPFVRDSSAEKQSDKTKSDSVPNGCSNRKELEYSAFFCMLAYQPERDRP